MVAGFGCPSLRVGDVVGKGGEVAGDAAGAVVPLAVFVVLQLAAHVLGKKWGKRAYVGHTLVCFPRGKGDVVGECVQVFAGGVCGGD
ncbi:MAG: hypothetical protein J6J97_00230 [Akkermansia sp.]|nr:hypothetical protein [Akkermansia sp.]